MQVYKWHHTASWEFLVSSAPRKSPRGMVFLFRNGSAFDEGGQRVFCESTLSGLLPICKLLPASPFVCFHKIPRRPPLLSRLAAAPIVFFSPLRQNHCQYVNYCLRSFPCLCANSLAVRLSYHASPLLLCVNFSQLRQNHCRAEGTACSKVRTGCSPLTWKCCTPSFPSGKVLSSIMEILFPPSCGFPPKSFPLKREPTISGDTFGTRA